MSVFEVFGLGFLSGIIFMVWILMRFRIIVVRTPKQRKKDKNGKNGKGPK